MKRFWLAAFLMLAGMPGARADGALALALPDNVTKDGFSSGISWDYKTAEEANARALSECLAVEAAPAETRKLCKVIQTFRDQCVAVALDPEDGTPGVGWAVADTNTKAREIALKACEDTAGKDRQGKCEVTTEACDGTAANRK